MSSTQQTTPITQKQIVLAAIAAFDLAIASHGDENMPSAKLAYEFIRDTQEWEFLPATMPRKFAEVYNG